MNPRANMERNEIMNELYAIIRELEQVSQELQPIKGVGMEHCASKLVKLSDKYKRIRNQL
ncbi:hypothetical protein [Cohnella boryungensis]|jgi:hypothetical protein|uniref:Spo0E like sporulation regulatory protein n=1 Tax=Cohnella boryungensis TaxID=768479 RepID=A0ABV8S7D2_9BACL